MFKCVAKLVGYNHWGPFPNSTFWYLWNQLDHFSLFFSPPLFIGFDKESIFAGTQIEYSDSIANHFFNYVIFIGKFIINLNWRIWLINFNKMSFLITFFLLIRFKPKFNLRIKSSFTHSNNLLVQPFHFNTFLPPCCPFHFGGWWRFLPLVFMWHWNMEEFSRFH